MSKIALALLMIVPVCSYGWPGPADETHEMLARAEKLYEGADFEKSIELLLRVDEMLQKQPNSTDEKALTKMQLALSFIGMNNNDRAKTYFLELFEIDPDYQLDTENLAPKVIALADEARAERMATRCQSRFDEAQNLLRSGNSDAVVKLIASNSGRCPAITSLATKAADLIYKEGLESFRKSQLTDALKKFRSALNLDPMNELAIQYIELTQSKLEVGAAKTLMAWRKDFDNGEFAMTARDYQELIPVSDPKTINDIRQEYRQSLMGLAEGWKRACVTEDAAAMDKIRTRANGLLPEPGFGQDILETMQTCVPTSCVPTDSALVMTRIDKRVDPVFSTSVLSRLKNLNVVVRVKAKIDAKGNVEIKDIQGGDPLLYSGIREAVDQWKFRPALTELGVRCVDTEIPIAIHSGN